MRDTGTRASAKRTLSKGVEAAREGAPQCIGKSLERAGSVTGEVVLFSGLVDDGHAGLSQEIHGTSFYYYLSVPHIMGILL